MYFKQIWKICSVILWLLMILSFFSYTYWPLKYSLFLVKYWFKYFGQLVENPCLVTPVYGSPFNQFILSIFPLGFQSFGSVLTEMFGIFLWMLDIIYEKL